MKLHHLLLGAALALVAAPAAFTQGFDQCGTVEAGVTCPRLFRADDQSLWLLDVSLSAYQVGDRLRVQGMADPSCINVCQQGNGCINGATLLTCGLTPPVICAPGAPNSTGQAGTVVASGSTQVIDDDLTLEAHQLPPGSFAYFVTSRTVVAPIPMPGGSQGFLCLGGSIGRFQSQVGAVSAAGVYRISTDPGAGAQRFTLTSFPQPNGTVAVMAGETWSFQCWHRDVAGGAATSNFSEGISLTFS
jgi:hypothetical protein